MLKIKDFKTTVKEESTSVQLDFSDTQAEHAKISPRFYFNEISTDELPEALSVSQFAEEACVTPQAVRKMISETRLQAKKLGEQYIILRNELNRYLEIK